MKPKLNKDIEWKKIGDQSLILLPAKSAFFKLNTTGTRILELIEKDLDTEKIIKTICNEYDTNPSEAKEDLSEFTEHLKKAEII